MGYTYVKHSGGTITNFWPDDDENTLYLDASMQLDLEGLMERIRAKWPNVALSSLDISAEHIHTSCLTYDLHDPSDYTTFIKVTSKL